MADPDELDEINRRIEILRDNLRRLVQQGAAYSGAADEARISERIADMEARLAELIEAARCAVEVGRNPGLS